MVGNHANFKDDDNTPEKRVERIFNLMDTVSFKVFLLVPAGPIKTPKKSKFSEISAPPLRSAPNFFERTAPLFFASTAPLLRSAPKKIWRILNPAL
jgi:hypothetical protein